MLLCRGSGEWVEDVCVMRGALLDGPVLHGRSDDISNRAIQLGTFINRGQDGLVDLFGQADLHHLCAEHIRPEEFAGGGLGEIQRFRCRTVDVDGLNSSLPGATSTHFALSEEQGGWRT